MRINVYSQELTKEVGVVSKVAEGIDGQTTYYGVRLWLASPDVLHHTADDDDRSAITFWIPHARSFGPRDLARVFRDAMYAVEDVAHAEEMNAGVRPLYDRATAVDARAQGQTVGDVFREAAHTLNEFFGGVFGLEDPVPMTRWQRWRHHWRRPDRDQGTEREWTRRSEGAQ